MTKFTSIELKQINSNLTKGTKQVYSIVSTHKPEVQCTKEEQDFDHLSFTPRLPTIYTAGKAGTSQMAYQSGKKTNCIVLSKKNQRKKMETLSLVN